MSSRSPVTRSFLCRGCGDVAGVFMEAFEGCPAGTVFHNKPEADANVRPVQCRLFQTLSPDDFAAVHADAPTLETLREQGWAPVERSASPEYTAAWIASQFQTPSQVRGYFDLHREERIACFPHFTALADLDEDDWRKIERLWAEDRASLCPNGGTN